MNADDAIKNLTAHMYCEFDNLPKAVGIAISEGIAALREHAEREKGCEWCSYFSTQSIKMPDGWIRAHHHCPLCGADLIGRRLEVKQK